MMDACVAGLDPGKDKCGIAILKFDGSVLFQAVIDTANLEKRITSLQERYEFTKLIIGDGTTSKAVRQRIEALSIECVLVDEKHTTEEARRIYWQENPPTGWRRFIPVTMQFPQRPVDDYVAVLLVKRYLKI